MGRRSPIACPPIKLVTVVSYNLNSAAVGYNCKSIIQCISDNENVLKLMCCEKNLDIQYHDWTTFTLGFHIFRYKMAHLVTNNQFDLNVQKITDPDLCLNTDEF